MLFAAIADIHGNSAALGRSARYSHMAMAKLVVGNCRADGAAAPATGWVG